MSTRAAQITFVNKIPAQNKGGISIPLVGSVTATVFTDVSVTFFGQKRDLQPNQSAAWTFNDPATAGSITYTYRIVPQAGLAAAVANQVVSTVAASLPPAPVNVPYVVETLVPLPTLPGANLPQLPQVNVPLPSLPGGTPPPAPATRCPTGTVLPQPGTAGRRAADDRGRPGRAVHVRPPAPASPQLSPASVAAAAAFDPSRYYVPGSSLGGPDRADSTRGRLRRRRRQLRRRLGAGLRPARRPGRRRAWTTRAPRRPPRRRTAAQTLPAAALAAVVALAAVTAALVRTHQASRARADRPAPRPSSRPGTAAALRAAAAPVDSAGGRAARW